MTGRPWEKVQIYKDLWWYLADIAQLSQRIYVRVYTTNHRVNRHFFFFFQEPQLVFSGDFKRCRSHALIKIPYRP